MAATAPTFGLFAGPSPRVRTIPPGAPFLALLAQHLQSERAGPDPFALADALVLTPNRRAARALGEALAAGAPAMLLPSIRPLGDLSEEEDFSRLEPIGPEAAALDLPPAIDPLRRRLELAALLRARGEAEGGAADPAHALAAADALCALLDSAPAGAAVRWERLSDLVREQDLAEHWRGSARFLQIIAAYWPQRLAAEGLSDPAARRAALLYKLADRWEQRPPAHPVIIAGSTGSLAPVRRLMQVVAGAPRGVVVLPGLDVDLDEAAWARLGEQHPQAALKETLEALSLDRAAVGTLPGWRESPRAAARRVLVREAMAPAAATADWTARVAEAAAPWGSPAAFIETACQGLRLIVSRTEEEEAAVAALLLRQTLETPDRTAALVTPDPALARRVSAKLSRWGIEAPVSAGAPLAETPIGVLLALLAALAADDGDPVALAALVAHPLADFAPETALRRLTDRHLRGPRRHTDLQALAQARDESAAPALRALTAHLTPLRAAFLDGQATAGAFAEALAASAEGVCGGPAAWAGAAGEAAGAFLTGLAACEDALGRLEKRQGPRVLASLLAGKVVAPEGSGHPRIALWGPLEARLQRRDLMILSGLNEGVWPALPAEDPFLSRSMRAELGLPRLEARIGLAAHDFVQFANAPDVVLTRAERAGGAPSVASRWVWRLETLTRGASPDALAVPPEDDPRLWARALDAPQSLRPVAPPRPTPAARGLTLKALSVTDVGLLARDPYAVYAKRILRLRPKDAVGAAPEAGERGQAIHAALETLHPGDDVAALLARLDAALAAEGFSPARRIAERARLRAAAAAIIAWEQARAAYTSFRERSGALALAGLTLTGRADRIDIRPDGGAEIIDYKSGAAPSAREVKSGFAPQLPLEAAMMKAGAFEGLAAATPDVLLYWRFAGSQAGVRAVALEQSVADAADEAIANLKDKLTRYAEPGQPFLSRPHVKFLAERGEYDHLARRKEWAESGEE